MKVAMLSGSPGFAPSRVSPLCTARAGYKCGRCAGAWWRSGGPSVIMMETTEDGSGEPEKTGPVKPLAVIVASLVVRERGRAPRTAAW